MPDPGDQKAFAASILGHKADATPQPQPLRTQQDHCSCEWYCCCKLVLQHTLHLTLMHHTYLVHYSCILHLWMPVTICHCILVAMTFDGVKNITHSSTCNQWQLAETGIEVAIWFGALKHQANIPLQWKTDGNNYFTALHHQRNTVTMRTLPGHKGMQQKA